MYRKANRLFIGENVVGRILVFMKFLNCLYNLELFSEIIYLVSGESWYTEEG